MVIIIVHGYSSRTVTTFATDFIYSSKPRNHTIYAKATAREATIELIKTDEKLKKLH